MSRRRLPVPALATVGVPESRRALRVHGGVFTRGTIGSTQGRVGLALLVVMVGVALLGPYSSPYSPTAVEGVPFAGPTSQHLLGTDVLGRDLLSRFLYGGRTLVLVALAATVISYLVGVPIGMLAGYRRGVADHVTVAGADLLFSFPALIFLLVLLTAVGTGVGVAIVGIAVVNTPRVIRIVRSVTREISTADFIEAAVARGERTATILRRDVLRNIATPVLADFGLRVTASIFLFASVSFLGLGEAPPAADWGLMISENAVGLRLQPLVIAVPALAIGALVVAVNLLTDSIARAAGRSAEDARV